MWLIVCEQKREEIKKYEKQIDEMVYKLYGLGEEVGIVDNFDI